MKHPTCIRIFSFKKILTIFSGQWYVKIYLILKLNRILSLFHRTTIVINLAKCKVFISYKKTKSCLGWRNRRRLYSNFLHARFRPISFCPCFNFVTSFVTKTQVQPGKVPTDGVRSNANRRGQIAFYDAILCLHLDVCCI
jgi:hypothetical protein